MQNTLSTEAEADHRRRELARAAAADAQAARARPQIGRRRWSPLPHQIRVSLRRRRATVAVEDFVVGVRGADVAASQWKGMIPM